MTHTNWRSAGHQRLLDVIRDQIGLTGTKEGCGEGECGACTVILDGQPVNACLVLAPQADGAEIVTIEGLTVDGTMSLLQQQFVEKGAVQCGFCSPGMIMTAKALLDDDPASRRGRRAGGPLGQPLPLHRLREDRRRGAVHGRACGGSQTAEGRRA